MNVGSILRMVLVSLTLVFFACAHHQKLPFETIHSVYSAGNDRETLISQQAPVFMALDYRADHNRIGRPSARLDDQGREDIYVDSQFPVIYFMEQTFSTPKDYYTNLIYRVHFSETPFKMIPFYLTAGKNVGLIVVITLDSRQKPVLITTVHTCGCYLAIVPTTFLPSEALPTSWKAHSLQVYGEKLPWQLDYSKTEHPKVIVHLRPGVHRVMNLEVIDEKQLQDLGRFNIIKASLKPMTDLERIPLENGFTSFYYQNGPLKGHVKGSIKPFESLFLSLPSLDFFVGADKAYADRRKTGDPFYTSLKPWNRSASNMWNFKEFLMFWGWNL